MRETLFNWLAPRIVEARCLDLFAGSGALGLEAISRGAGHVTFVERDPRAAQAIEDVLTAWGETNAGTVVRGDARRLLASGDSGSAAGPLPYDVVFLDPPFADDLLVDVMQSLDPRWLAHDARIYVEHAARAKLPSLPSGWEVLKSGRAGEVGYDLIACRGGMAAEREPE